MHDEFSTPDRRNRKRAQSVRLGLLIVGRALNERREAVFIILATPETRDKRVQSESDRTYRSAVRSAKPLPIAEGVTHKIYLIVKDTIESTIREIDLERLDDSARAVI